LFRLNKDIQSIIVVLDHKFGKLKIYENEDHKNLLGLDLRSNIEHALSYFQDKGLNLTILIHEDLIPNDFCYCCIN
jgi:hypothetical protein